MTAEPPVVELVQAGLVPVFGNVPGTPMLVGPGDGCSSESPSGFDCGGRILHIGPHAAYELPGPGDPGPLIVAIWFTVLAREP